jgi:hypothetical protein
MISGMNPFSFLAIPFFIFAGEIMMYGGIADRIVAFANIVAATCAVAWHEQRARLHALRRRAWLAGGRRLGHGCGAHPADEEGGLRRRLRRQRHHARLAGGRADATSHNIIIFTLAAAAR